MLRYGNGEPVIHLKVSAYMVNRLAAAITTTAISAALVIGAASPAHALDNAPVATGPAAEAMVQVYSTFGPGDGGTCTGTAVSPTQVLTARHCITDAESVRVSGYGSAGRIDVTGSVQDNTTGNDVALLTLAQPWTGPTLPMSTERVNTGATLDFYGMGDTGILRTASGQVRYYGTVNGNRLNRGPGGDVVISQLRLGAAAESGDSGGPIMRDGRVVGVIQSITTRDASLVLGAPLSTSRAFIQTHGRPSGALPLQWSDRVENISETTGRGAMTGPLAPTSQAETSSTDPTAEALGAVLAVLLALGVGVHSGVLELPVV